MKTTQFTFLAVAVIVASLHADAKTELPAFLTDNMVVQQNATLTIPGKTDPGAVVKVSGSWSDAMVEVKAGADGSFRAVLPTPAAGGPFSITIADGEDETVLNNVLSGEVWLCSGQSNMEFPMNGDWASVMGYDTLIPTANHPDIRLLQIKKQTAFVPQSDCRVNMGGWVECNPATVSGFSAIAYLYARELSQKLHVPIGVIDTTWGGTPAEAWTSFNGVKSISGFEQETEAMLRFDFDGEKLVADYDARIERWLALATSQSEISSNIAPSGNMPTGLNWENSVFQTAFDGMVSVSKSIDIPAEAAGKLLTLYLGAIDDDDITYFNGVEIGRGSGYNVPRVYTVPAELVKAGVNEIRCHITDTGGGGGFNGGDRMRAVCAGGEISLEGEWSYRVISDFALLPKRPTSVLGPNYPTVLYNAMINPLAVMPIKGVIWYQGCANVGRAEQYGPLFRRLISDWRALWGQPLMPFHFVQLAGYQPTSYCQPESEWAALRNAQAEALGLPATGMAVAIDLGNPADIHPRNKQDVAHRLALLAFSRCYGIDTVCTAPRLVSHQTIGNKMKLTFSGNIVPTSVALPGFIIAGKDGVFFPADARKVDEHTVELSSPKVKQPAIARYNWADCPGGNIYGSTGLPVAPFATDKPIPYATEK